MLDFGVIGGFLSFFDTPYVSQYLFLLLFKVNLAMKRTNDMQDVQTYDGYGRHIKYKSTTYVWFSLMR